MKTPPEEQKKPRARSRYTETTLTSNWGMSARKRAATRHSRVTQIAFATKRPHLITGPNQSTNALNVPNHINGWKHWIGTAEQNIIESSSRSPQMHNTLSLQNDLFVFICCPLNCSYRLSMVGCSIVHSTVVVISFEYPGMFLRCNSH